MSNLSLVQLTALVKLAEKQVKEKKDRGETVEPGNYDYSFDLHVEGKLSKGADTKVSPSFYMDKCLKAVLLHCAQKMPGQGPAWLNDLLSIDGALGAVVKLGPDMVLRRIDQQLLAIWDNAEEEAKKQFQLSQPKADRAGNTVVVGELEVPKVLAAKKKPK